MRYLKFSKKREEMTDNVARFMRSKTGKQYINIIYWTYLYLPEK